MSGQRVLFAHELAVIGRAVERVLGCHGFEVQWVQRADEARARLAAGGVDALVLDVALPDEPGFGLIEEARGFGVNVVLLVAAVYRKTSYKRRPTRLYGADDYVEIHHLGDHLPLRLRRHLGLEGGEGREEEAQRIHEMLDELGDERLRNKDARRLAEVLVADLLLYNGDAFSIDDAHGVRRRLDEQLGGVQEIFAGILPEQGDGPKLLEAALQELIDDTVISDAALARSP